MATYRAALPKTRILLLGLLPRAGRYWEPDQRAVWPNAHTRPLAAVNAGYQACATTSMCPGVVFIAGAALPCKKNSVTACEWLYGSQRYCIKRSI